MIGVVGRRQQPASHVLELGVRLRADEEERIADGVDPAHGQRGMASTAVVAVVADGLITGLMLLRERSTSITTHRFGNTFTID